MKVNIGALMERCGVRFGTSGARGLANDITDFVAYAYTRAFISFIETTFYSDNRGRSSICSGNYNPSFSSNEKAIAVAGDLRPSTDRIIRAVLKAVADSGYKPIYCGKIPSPALALYGFSNLIPTIMVTGSHIPSDRNGIKFNKPDSELLKKDEEEIRRQVVEIDESLFDNSGFLKDKSVEYVDYHEKAVKLYTDRYLNFFGYNSLTGLKVCVYQHSAVGREILVNVLQKLGVRVIPIGFSEDFIPVDTEAIRETDIELAKKWAKEFSPDSIVSTDGDSDRPLISDEYGNWLKGDIVGLLCARFLNADSVSIPVSCNTAIDKCGFFKEVRRTKIGSPYVISSMMDAVNQGRERVVGFEANGGFLLQSRVIINNSVLEPLPTRDALLPIISILYMAKNSGNKISRLISQLPKRFTSSNRLTNFDQSRSSVILREFNSGDDEKDIIKAHEIFGCISGRPVKIDRTDGIRMFFENGEIIHLRPSGNAPEFRCYTEADSQERADEINKASLEIIREKF
jgi:phosphomannomutase